MSSQQQQQREEELLSVQSIYCDAYNTFEALDETHFRFRSVPIVLSITLPLSYPDPTQLLEVTVDSDGLGVSPLQIFQLRMRLESIVQSKPDEPVLFDLTEETREFTEALREDVRVCLEEEDEEQEEEQVWEHYNMAEDSTNRVTDHAIVRGHMGQSRIEGIMSRLPPTTKLLHAELVLRTDLRQQFLQMQRKIQQVAAHGTHDRRARDAAYDRFGKEEIVFHGTLRQNVGSIVRSGFVVPGGKTATGEVVDVRCGSTWGQGIYTSPDPEYSLSYADHTEGGVKGHRRLLPGQKLIVCAILMGRRRLMNNTRRLNPSVEEGYDSHVSPNKLEYVVFNSAQVLPLYVLHLGNRSASSDQSGSLNFRLGKPAQVEGNLTEYARKHLPTGFGAARGHRFVVEAVAPVDDDEELWGDYQHDEEGEFQEERKSTNWWWT
ncbi:hypothetical protein LshimejAT787_1901660 [Lyophyllum shimeji]|uniref:RWD domain-containing protein n=1 Tax=Lyophyllum shimeji TaxID=47721 RepID=A0A9P3PZY5_LYOSH|nr:hypothetical protein LshimejAT787_1901660 [Lyophyllum shimeji]